MKKPFPPKSAIFDGSFVRAGHQLIAFESRLRTWTLRYGADRQAGATCRAYHRRGRRDRQRYRATLCVGGGRGRDRGYRAGQVGSDRSRHRRERRPCAARSKSMSPTRQAPGAVVASTIEAFGRLTTLVNVAAAVTPDGTVETLTSEEWNRAIGVNLTGAFLMCKYAVPQMRRSGGGCIINIASQLGHLGVPLRSPYCTTKAALTALHAHSRHGSCRRSASAPTRSRRDSS